MIVGRWLGFVIELDGSVVGNNEGCVDEMSYEGDVVLTAIGEELIVG